LPRLRATLSVPSKAQPIKQPTSPVITEKMPYATDPPINERTATRLQAINNDANIFAIFDSFYLNSDLYIAKVMPKTIQKTKHHIKYIHLNILFKNNEKIKTQTQLQQNSLFYKMLNF
jgi:hypothetical protein